nr:beta-phosphoglucomutase family hydrolase [Parenemella sanctibonifatiensis]
MIFDLDGVVTNTATVHAAAWKRLFDEALADPRLDGGPYAPFDVTEDYRRYVDGRSREDGVAAFLAARGIEIKPGADGGAADDWSVRGLAARKNRIYLDLLAEQGVRVFPGTVDLLQRLRAGGVPVGLVTASRNAEQVLAVTGLNGLFDVVVDGRQAEELGLPGKPDPAMFLRAAERLGVDPARAAVVEDAVAGVRGARAGGSTWWSGWTGPVIVPPWRPPGPASSSPTSPNWTSGRCAPTPGPWSMPGSTRPTGPTGRWPTVTCASWAPTRSATAPCWWKWRPRRAGSGSPPQRAPPSPARPLHLPCPNSSETGTPSSSSSRSGTACR